MLVQIKAKQDEILNDYAQNCITDVTSCLNQNNYPISTAANNVQQRVAINACRNTVITCMSVTGYSTENPTPAQMANWVYGILGQLQSQDDNSATTPGYVQSQKTITYQCDSVGAESHNVSPVLVSTDGKWNHKDACSKKTGYTCAYCNPGTTCQPGTANSTNQLVTPTNYTVDRDYSLEYSSVIKFVCNENMMEDPVTYSCGNHATSAGLEEQVGVITQKVNIRNGCTPAPNYTCSYKYDEQPVSVGRSVDYVTGVNQIVADCEQTGITLTYGCGGNGTNSDVNLSLSQQYSVNPNACTTPTGYTCKYMYGETDVTNGNAFNLNAATTEISFNCTPNPYSVTFDCGDFADPISGVEATQDVTYGTPNSLTNACTAKNGYNCTSYAVAGTNQPFNINSDNYPYDNDITITPVCNARTTLLRDVACDTSSTSGSGTFNVTLTHGETISAPQNCTPLSGYGDVCKYVQTNSTIGVVGQEYNYNSSFNNTTSATYKCERNTYTITISCGNFGPISSVSSWTQNLQYGGGWNPQVAGYCSVSSEYTCNGWLIDGTETAYSGTLNVADNITLVPNCTTGE